MGADGDVDSVWRNETREWHLKQMMHAYNERQWVDEEQDDDEVDYEVVDTPTYDHQTIAETLMRELVSNGLETMIVLKDDAVREWWAGVLKEEKRLADELAKKEAARIKREDDARAKAELVSRLTPEERRLLGIKK